MVCSDGKLQGFISRLWLCSEKKRAAQKDTYLSKLIKVFLDVKQLDISVERYTLRIDDLGIGVFGIVVELHKISMETYEIYLSIKDFTPAFRSLRLAIDVVSMFLSTYCPMLNDPKRLATCASAFGHLSTRQRLSWFKQS